MPIKLKRSDLEIIAVCILVAMVSLLVGVKYFWRAFPEAAIDFRVNRDDSEPIARQFLAGQGIQIDGYRHVAVFDYDEPAKVFLERTLGLERMTQLARGPVRLWRWSNRWFKPQQQEEFRVAVTPSGEVVGFDHEIPEAAPGANLDAARAREIAEDYLRGVMKRDLADLEFAEAATEKRPARTDHDFIWRQQSVDLGEGEWRIAVSVAGDRVAGYREYVKVPEQWSRDYQQLRSRNESAQLVAEVFFLLLTIGMLVILVRRLRDRDVPVKLSLILGLVGTVLYFLGQLNNFAVAEFGYATTDSYSSFIAGYLLSSLLSAAGVGAWIFFLTASAEPVYRASFPRLTALGRAFRWEGLRSRSFFMANVVGITLTFFFFAYQTVFYLTANKLGAWSPADVNYSDLLSTKIPWVWVLFIGFLPAISEELQFRAFAIPFLHRILRHKAAALVLAAFIWGFMHSAYPNQPFFIRGLEVGIGGIIIGLVMLRFGLVATLVWHYTVDALYTAFLLLRSPNHYLMVSGAITAGIMLVPLSVSLIAYLRSGTFSDENSLSNAGAGISRAPRREAESPAETPLAYRPLNKSRFLLAGAMTAIFVAMAFVPVHRFGEDTEVAVTRQAATRIADEFLRERDLDPATYRRVAWLYVNVDPQAIKYLQEHRTIEQTDRLYREATHILLWQVRYFRPLEKDEYRVFVDAAEPRAFSYRHILDEAAPGATLTREEARARAADFLARQGYSLDDFNLQEQAETKRKARTDWAFEWETKSSGPGAPLTVADAHFRLHVDVAGDQVVGLSRFFKLPEEWVRHRSATTLINAFLGASFALLLVVLAGRGLAMLVHQIRRGVIRWGASARLAGVVVAAMVAAELNHLSIVFQNYDTSEPLTNFWIKATASLIVVPLALGLAAWMLIGLATSLYPDSSRLLRAPARRVWARDATMAIALTLAAAFGLSRLGALVYGRFHTVAPVRFDLGQELLDSTLPGAGFVFRGLMYALVFPVIAAIVIYVFERRDKWDRWWLGVSGALLMISLGPSGAHSPAEYFVGWTVGFLTLLVAIGLVALFFRDNFAAYVGAAFGLTVAEPLASMLSQPAAFFQWNGMLLALCALAFFAWLLRLFGRRDADPPSAPASQL